MVNMYRWMYISIFVIACCLSRIIFSHRQTKRLRQPSDNGWWEPLFCGAKRATFWAQCVAEPRSDLFYGKEAVCELGNGHRNIADLPRCHNCSMFLLVCFPECNLCNRRNCHEFAATSWNGTESNYSELSQKQNGLENHNDLTATSLGIMVDQGNHSLLWSSMNYPAELLVL